MVEILFKSIPAGHFVFIDGVKYEVIFGWPASETEMHLFTSKRHCERFAGQRTFAYED